MRVLIDECLPRRLAAALSGVDAVTVPEAGWAGQSNGALLDLAAREFDVLITMDRGMEFQQDLGGRDLCVVVLVAPSNRLDALAPLVPDILAALQAVRPGDVVRIGA